MKKLIILGLILLGTQKSEAQIFDEELPIGPGFVEKAMNTHTEKMTIDLNPHTVLCSAVSYTMPLLKVNIPQLADITFLNHRNEGAGGPCMFTPGACNQPNKKKLIDIYQPTEEIVITVTQSRLTRIDKEKNTCEVWLKEHLTTNIRGLPFIHTQFSLLPERVIADCKESKALELQ